VEEEGAFEGERNGGKVGHDISPLNTPSW